MTERQTEDTARGASWTVPLYVYERVYVTANLPAARPTSRIGPVVLRIISITYD